MKVRASGSTLGLSAALFLVVVSLHGQSQTWQPPNQAGEGQNPVMPVYQEPHHRQLLVSGPMRLIELQIPPGDSSWFHMHDHPIFYLTVADSQTRTQIFGEEWGGRGGARGAGAAPRAGGPAPAAPAAAGAAPATPAAAPPGPRAAGPGAGAAGGAPRAGGPGAGAAAGGTPRYRPRLFFDVSYADRAVTHRIENNGMYLYRALGVINETAGGDESVTEEAAGFGGKAEMGNKYFRIHRVALAPGEKTPPHQHKAPVVLLEDVGGKGMSTGAMNFEFSEPGSWGFYDKDVRHEITNSGTDRLEIIEVEVRRK